MRNYYTLNVILFVLSACTDMCWSGPCYPIPGDTRANPTAQAMAQHSFFESAKYYKPACKDMRVDNAKYKGLTGWGDDWSETWTINSCGVQLQGDVVFNPNGHVSRNVGLKEIK